MGYVDLILGPIYFLLIYLAASSYAQRLPNKFLRKHFVNGLLFKLIGAVGVSLVYWYVYGGGDSIYYFKRSLILKDIIFDDFSVGIRVLFSNANEFNPETNYAVQAVKAYDFSSFMVVRFATIANFFCFESYICISLIFAVFSFYGIWKAFQLFVSLYPEYESKIAIAFFYIPSVAFWGSGIFKDNITYGFLCLLIVSLHEVLFKQKNIFSNLFIIAVSIYIIGTVKSYILMAFLPSFGIWFFLEYRRRIKSSLIRSISTPVFILLAIASGAVLLKSLGDSFSKFSVENFEEKASGMQRWHTQRVVVEKKGEGSVYSLGDIDFSPIGILKKAPLAIAVAIYRPFVWEARNATMLLSALESLALLFLSLQALPFFFSKPVKATGILFDNPGLVFCLAFSLIFAFSVGFTSYNFGALSRYRIPFLPFYFVFISVLLDKLKPPKILKKQIA